MSIQSGGSRSNRYRRNEGVDSIEYHKIYLDCCCFNRPFDDISQEKIRHECEAILTIVSNCELGVWDVFRSDVLDDEIDRIVNPIKKLKVLKLYSSATIGVEINNEIIARAKKFQQTVNLKSFDALHLAGAEYGKADILLTTDNKFISRAKASDSKIRVANPAIWMTEVLFND